MPAPKPRRDKALIKALVQRKSAGDEESRAARAKSITDLAEQEGVTNAYVCRLLPLTCLAPDIVEAILDGRQPKGLRLAEMLGNGWLVWKEQRARSGASATEIDVLARALKLASTSGFRRSISER